ERHQKLRVVDLQAVELVDLPHLVADDEAEIPERMQNRAQRLLFVDTQMAAEKDQEVDVGMEAELTASVAADGDDGDRLLRARRGGKHLPDHRVEAVGEARERRAAAVSAQDVVAQLTPRFGELGGKRRRLLTERTLAGAGRIGHGGAPHTLYRVARP